MVVNFIFYWSNPTIHNIIPPIGLLKHVINYKEEKIEKVYNYDEYEIIEGLNVINSCDGDEPTSSIHCYDSNIIY